MQIWASVSRPSWKGKFYTLHEDIHIYLHSRDKDRWTSAEQLNVTTKTLKKLAHNNVNFDV